jgi:hypothetical protein
MHLLLSTCFVLALSSTSLGSVTCVKVNIAATASWTNSASQTCTWTRIVESNFRTTASSSEYVSLPWLGDES